MTAYHEPLCYLPLMNSTTSHSANNLKNTFKYWVLNLLFASLSHESA